VTYNFILIGNNKGDVDWRDRLRKAVAPLGKLQTLTEKEAQAREYSSDRHVIIMDESGVKRVEDLVSRFSNQLNPPYIVVVCAARPSWDDTLRMFKAGATDYIPKDSGKGLAIFFKELLAGSRVQF